VDGSEQNEATQPPVTEALENQKSRAIATLETGLAPSSNPCLPAKSNPRDVRQQHERG
jgi:hypothetical protein